MSCAEVAMLQPASEIARLKLVLVCQQQAASTSLIREEGLAEKRRQAIHIYRKLFVISRVSCLTVINSHQRWTQQLVCWLMSTNSKSDYIRGIAGPAETTVRHFHSPIADHRMMPEQRRRDSQKRRLP